MLKRLETCILMVLLVFKFKHAYIFHVGTTKFSSIYLKRMKKDQNDYHVQAAQDRKPDLLSAIKWTSQPFDSRDSPGLSHYGDLAAAPNSLLVYRLPVVTQTYL